MMKCPQCFKANPDGSTECESCGVQFKDLRRGREAAKQDNLVGQLCAWNDHGVGCRYKGIISSTTNGAGNWYCRQHWSELNGEKTEVRGNSLPPVVAKPKVNRAPVKIRTEIPPVAEWMEGEEYRAFRERVRERVALGVREPGDDDEDVIEEAQWVDQA